MGPAHRMNGQRHAMSSAYHALSVRGRWRWASIRLCGCFAAVLILAAPADAARRRGHSRAATPASATASAPASAAESAIAADRAADLVGVNTHVGYRGQIYDSAWSSIIRPRLLELGARHIRDTPGDPGDLGIKRRYAELAKAGIRTLLINYQTIDKDYVTSTNALGGTQVIEAVEPPNERDNTGNGWEAELRSFMTWMYPAYRGDPATQAITVLGPSFADTRNSPLSLASAFPGASNYLEYGNLHDYSGLFPESPQAGGWGISLPAAFETYRRVSGTKPPWVTENGYKMSGSGPGHPAVTQRAAAKYLPRQFLVHLRMGVEKFYIYELIDDHEDFGLLNIDGSYRLQYTSVRNFISIFNDPGSSFNTGSMSYSLSGDMSGVEHLLLQKRNGAFYLVLWQGVASVSGTTDGALRDIEPSARKLTLNLATRIREAHTYLPSFSMQQTASYSNANGIGSVTVSVPDHILVVELIP